MDFKTLALSTLVFISPPLTAAILDLGSVTRDTSTGLDWLDLTETLGRSYLDVSGKMDEGEEFYGWRHATRDEVRQLWINFGLPDGTNSSVQLDSPLGDNYRHAVELLGDTIVEHFDGRGHGTIGVTGSSFSTYWNYLAGMHNWNPGMHSHDDGTETVPVPYNRTEHVASVSSGWIGNYLVAPSPVPLPAAAWLFISAITGLAYLKRRQS